MRRPKLIVEPLSLKEVKQRAELAENKTATAQVEFANIAKHKLEMLAEIKKYREELEEVGEDIKKSNEIRQKLTDEIADYEERKVEEGLRLTNAQSLTEEATRKAKNLIDSAQKVASDIINSAGERVKTVEKREEKVKEDEKAVKELESMVNAAIEIANKKMQTLKDDEKSLKDDIVNLTLRRDALLANCDALKVSYDKLKLEVDQIERNKSLLKDFTNELLVLEQKLADKNEELRKAGDVLTKTKEETDAKITELRNVQTATDTKIGRLKQDIERAKAEGYIKEQLH